MLDRGRVTRYFCLGVVTPKEAVVVGSMSFGETLAGLRKDAGLTQTELARRADVPIDNLRRWEQDRHLPRVDDAYRLAKALGVGVDKLIIDKDMMPADEPPKHSKKGGK